MIAALGLDLSRMNILIFLSENVLIIQSLTKSIRAAIVLTNLKQISLYNSEGFLKVWGETKLCVYKNVTCKNPPT